MEGTTAALASIDIARLGAAFDRITRLLRSARLPGDLSPVAASALYTLAMHGPSRLTALAEAERVTQPAMTQVIGRLEAAGFVARGADPDDGRVVIVSCTETGRDLVARRRAARADVLAELIAHLPASDAEALGAAIGALERLASAR